MRRISCAVALLCLACLPAASKPTPKPATPACQASVAKVTEGLQAQIADDPSLELTVYAGDRAAKVLDAFNAMPPASTFKAERLLVLSNTEGGVALILLANGDCITKALPLVRLEAWRKMVKKAIGDNA